MQTTKKREPKQTQPATLPPPMLLAALWAARLIVELGGHKRFIRNHGFADADVLELLGLEEYEDTSLSQARRRDLLKRRYRVLEKAVAETELRFPTIVRLGERLSLCPVQQRVLLFLAVAQTCPPLRDTYAFVPHDYIGRNAELLARLLKLDIAEVQAAVGGSSTLARSGLVRVSSPGLFDRTSQYTLLEGLGDALLGDPGQLETVFRGFFRPLEPGQLAAEDYAHIDTDLRRIRRLIEGARRSRAHGINVLIYGAPGVGKSELARLLARLTDSSLYEITSEDDDGEPITGSKRFRALQLCQLLLGNSADALVLFDEVEDVLALPGDLFFAPPRETSKAWTNQQLESNPVPTLWLSNSIERIDPAHLRRFDYVLELSAPPRDKRLQMIDNATADLDISADWRAQLAKVEGLTPAQIAQAARVARLIGDDGNDQPEEVMQTVIERQLKLQGSTRSLRRQADELLDYDAGLLNVATDLERVAGGLARSGEGTLLLYGPPGTGKTAFAQHLADRLERPLASYSASELLDKYVGGTEQRLAQMFEQAAREGAVLLLDEADSFLRSRRLAEQQWQLTQVNELLLRMEHFQGVFVCATNFLEITDDAALRRFDLKLRFDYLRPEQRWEMLRNLLGRLGLPVPRGAAAATAKAALASLERLTPGDFATVARRARRLGLQSDLNGVLADLAAECELKPEAQKRPVGFVH